jgi:hypothetical protein
MIKDPLEFSVGKLKIDVNWEPEVVPCKKIRVRFGEYEEIIEPDELYTMLMLFGNDEQQEKLIPVTRTEMIRVERLLHVKATKNIKKGEFITVPYRYSLNREAYEVAVRENPRSFRILDADKLSTNPQALQEGEGVV